MSDKGVRTLVLMANGKSKFVWIKESKVESQDCMVSVDLTYWNVSL